ncbi:MAG: hypothetical protein WBF42_16780 [Terracidiphilus sp.]
MMNVILVIVPMLGMIVLVWVLARLIVSPADAGRSVNQAGGEIEFAPNKRGIVAAPVFVGFLVYLGVTMLISSLPSFLNIFGGAFWMLLAVLILMTYPARIFAGDQGLRQTYWLGKTRRIAWKDVSQVIYDENKHRLTIKGQGGTKIIHTRQLPDRARLVAELEKHCEDKVPAELRKTTATTA